MPQVDREIEIKVERELMRIRASRPNESSVRHGWTVADSKYKEHVLEGNGGSANGAAILSHYIMRQAYFLYAQERGFSLEVS